MGSAVYNCCWSSPAQSFSGLSPAALMTIFYCLGFETPKLEGQVPVFTSLETGWHTTKPNRLMLFREITVVSCENRMKQTLCAQKVEPYYVKAGGTYSNDWALTS
jgi:hypothetical protein